MDSAAQQRAGEAVASEAKRWRRDVEMLAQGSADTRREFVEQHNAGTLAKAKAGEVELPLGRQRIELDNTGGLVASEPEGGGGALGREQAPYPFPFRHIRRSERGNQVVARKRGSLDLVR